VGLRRLRNLVLVVAPYAVTVPLAFVMSERLDSATSGGLIALVLAPGALLAPSVVNAAGGRRADMAGALLLGTVIVSFALVATRAGGITPALTGAQAFVVASIVAGALPTVRDRLLVPLRWVGHAAGLAVVVLAAASGPRVDAATIAAALATVALLLVVAGGAALVLRRDVFSALAATGTRDPIVATALAWSSSGAEATGVPLASAVILGIAAAALVIRRR
jgi:hypothetical protein